MSAGELHLRLLNSPTTVGMFFFEVDVEIQIEPELRGGESVLIPVTTLYHLSGNEGTVTRIFADMRAPEFAISTDSRQMLITDTLFGAVPPWGRQREAIFFLYDTQTWERLHEFHIAFREPVGRAIPWRTPEGGFIVEYGGAAPIGGGGAMVIGIYALATFDPVTMVLEVLWDRTDWSMDEWRRAEDFQRPPRIQTFMDDRGAHQFDRTLHLERVIFAPTPQYNTLVENPESIVTQERQGNNNNRFIFMILISAGLLLLGVILIVSKKRKEF